MKKDTQTDHVFTLTMRGEVVSSGFCDKNGHVRVTLPTDKEIKDKSISNKTKKLKTSS